MIDFKITFQAEELLYGDYEKMSLLCYTLGAILSDFPFFSVAGHLKKYSYCNFERCSSTSDSKGRTRNHHPWNAELLK